MTMRLFSALKSFNLNLLIDGRLFNNSSSTEILACVTAQIFLKS